MNNILFFGDSLTAGYGLEKVSDESFPALIERKIKAAGLPYHVINAGLSGDTSAGGLSRIDYWISQPISIFILELGVNDVLRGISPKSTLHNLQAIINRVIEKYPNVSMAIMGMELPSFIPGTFATEFRAIFRTLAEANNMKLVPFFLDGVVGLAHLNLQDGVHPSAKGYEIIADNVWPTIKDLLANGS